MIIIKSPPPPFQMYVELTQSTYSFYYKTCLLFVFLHVLKGKPKKFVMQFPVGPENIFCKMSFDCPLCHKNYLVPKIRIQTEMPPL